MAACKFDIQVTFLGFQIVLPQHESEMLTSLMSKVPASYNQDAMVTVCALRDDVTSSQQLVTETSDPFLAPLGSEDNPQQHTSPEQTEDDEPLGEELNQPTN
jgi:hypothetical protein